MTSRIAKMLCETAGTRLLSDAESLRRRDIAIVVGSRATPVMVRSAVALVLRCFDGNVILRGAATLPLEVALVAHAQKEAAEYGPCERLIVDGVGGDLVLGLSCATGQVYIDARAWTVSVNKLLEHGPPPTAPAAAFAVAAGVAKLFASVIGRPDNVLTEAWSATMVDLPAGPGAEAWLAPIDLGRLLVIGAGAIGSGLAHVLRHSAWRGEVLVVDRERYEEPNHETTMLISQATAMRRAPKAVALSSVASSEGLVFEGQEAVIGSSHAILREHFRSIACAVDNPEARRCLDGTAARVVLNAGVGGSRADAGHVLCTRHGSGDPTLSSYYSDDSTVSVPAHAPDDVGEDECSRIAYASVALAAPFMGLAAGALLAAGLAQCALAPAAPINYIKYDLLGLQAWHLRQSRGVDPI